MRVLLLTALLMYAGSFLSFAQPKSPADPNAEWVGACEDAVKSKVMSEHGNAEKVTFSADSLMESQASNAENKLEGNGSFLPSDGDWKNFSFECIYNIRNGKVTSADYDEGGQAEESSSGSEVQAKDTGACTLLNTKSGKNTYDGPCNLKQTMSGSSNEYVIKLGNGNSYRFVQHGSMYEVEAPEGKSDKPATMTDQGDMAIFEWGHWSLSAVQD